MAIMGTGDQQKRQEKDPVCGRLVVVELAVGPEESDGGEVWFCSLGCQAQYQEETEAREGSAEGHRRAQPPGVEA